jgi:hypothetical protein
VLQEFSGDMHRARNPNPRVFWASLAQDHAVLSKDINKVRLYGPWSITTNMFSRAGVSFFLKLLLRRLGSFSLILSLLADKQEPSLCLILYHRNW